MKNVLKCIAVVLTAFALSGCSGQQSLESGQFKCYLYGDQDDTVSIQFNQDGTGFEALSELIIDFDWVQSGKAITITPNNKFNRLMDFAVFDNYEYRNGYIVPTEAACAGKIPNKDTFSATIERSDSNGRTEHREFHKDGTISYWQQDFTDSKDTETYTRTGDFIVVTNGEYTYYFLVADGTMYTSYFCPVDKLPENL